MGLEFRDAAYALGPKCARTAKSNMVFSLTIGFNNIPDAKTAGSTYAISLIDTVKVGKSNSTVLSQGMKAKDEIMFFNEVRRRPVSCPLTPTLQPEDQKPSKASLDKDGKGARKPPVQTAVVKSKLRNEGREVDGEAMNRRKAHQKEIAARRQEDGLEKYAEDGGGGKGGREKQWRRFESYKREAELPDLVANQKVRLVFPPESTDRSAR